MNIAAAAAAAAAAAHRVQKKVCVLSSFISQLPYTLLAAASQVISDVFQPGMIKVGSKWMYPEDEVTDGGTFEHRKRIKEMQETEARARELTTLANRKGAHHISDYLPQGVRA